MSRITRLREKRNKNRFSIKMFTGILVSVFSVLSIVLYTTVFAEVDQLGPSELTNGGYIQDSTPTFEFFISDDEEELPLRYLIEVCTEYTGGATCLNSRVISYESAQDIAPEDPELHTFTVGQEEGDGNYLIGGEDQTLDDGHYWWRVQTIEDGGSAETANFVWAGSSGNPAFILDTTPPTISLNPISPNPTNSTTATLTGIATDELNTVSSVEYQINSTAGSWTECSAVDGTFNEDEEDFICNVEDLNEGENTVYVRGTDDEGVTTESDFEFETVFVDTQDPQITEGPEVAVTDASATITWVTDDAATSIVEYGFSDTYGNEKDSPALSELHEIELSNLLNCATYSYRVGSEDEAGNTTYSSNLAFTTEGCIGDSSILSQTSSDPIPAVDGGIVALIDGEKGIELVIPSNYSDEDLVFQIKNLDLNEVLAVTSTPEDHVSIANYVYDLKAVFGTNTNVTSFDEPVSIIIYFDEEEVDGIDLSSLAIFRWNGFDWETLDNCSLEGNSITCETGNFSTFGLFGEGETPTPPSPSSSGNSKSFFSSSPPSCTDALPNGTPNLFQIDASDTQARLYFSPLGSPNNKYAVVYGYEAGEERFGVMFNHGLASGVLSYTINDLDPNSTYYFKIRGQNGCMPGSWSNEMKITTKTIGSQGGTTFYKDFASRVLSIFPKEVTEVNN